MHRGRTAMISHQPPALPDLPSLARRGSLFTGPVERLETCQRTSVFLLLLILKSTKISQLYLACFQSSAARPQAPATILCIGGILGSRTAFSYAIFAASCASTCKPGCGRTCNRIVGIWQKPCPARHSAISRFSLAAVCYHPVMPLLEAKHLVKSFPSGQSLLGARASGEIRAVNDVSLAIEAGETLGTGGRVGLG